MAASGWWESEKNVLANETKLLEKSSKDSLASKDEMIKLLKRNKKSLTDRISNYEELEVVQGKAHISVEAAKQKSQNTHILREQNKQKKTDTAKQNMADVNSQHCHVYHPNGNQQFSFMVCFSPFLS